MIRNIAIRSVKACAGLRMVSVGRIVDWIFTLDEASSFAKIAELEIQFVGYMSHPRAL